MNKGFRNTVILGLAFTVALVSVFCCCIPDSVQADEAILECHQETNESNDFQNHNSEDCNCPKILSITIDKLNNDLHFSSVIYNLIPVSFWEHISFVPTSMAYQAPPIVYDTSPLYIKHSVLRI